MTNARRTRRTRSPWQPGGRKGSCTRREAIALAAGSLSALSAALLAGCSASEEASGTAGASNGEDASVTATFFKAGAADATLLQSESAAILIDTGLADDAEDLVEEIVGLGTQSIDLLVISHFDKDHVGGAATVLRNLDVARVVTTYQSVESDAVSEYEDAVAETGLTPEVIASATHITLGGMELQITPPDLSEYEDDTSNNSSLVVRVCAGEQTFLFAGDVQEERIDELLSDGVDLTCDVLKVPHHGRWEDNTANLVAAASPAYAVITSSKDEKEDDEVVDELEAAGAEVLLTRKGTVSVIAGAAGLTVSQE